jgi:hypothetical protein
MAINTIEQAIITQLETYITTLQVEGFPDKPSEYRLLHPTGAILVSYNGSNFSTPEGAGFILQTQNLEFSITVIVRNLRDKNGAYSHIDSIISTLTGFSPGGCGKMYPTTVTFLNESNGIWQYGMTFMAPSENYNP